MRNRSVLTAKLRRSNVKHPAVFRLQHKDERQRRLAVRRLFELDDPESLSGFIPLLSDEDPWFRRKAMEAVGRWFGHGQGNVARMLAESPYPEQRVLATNLALRSEGGGMEMLLELCEDSEPSVRLAAWKARLGVDNSKIAAVIALALNDEEVEVRRIALRRLSIMEVIDPDLLRAVLSDPSPRVVAAAVSLVEKRSELREDIEVESQLITIAKGGGSSVSAVAIGVLADKSLDSPDIAALVLGLVEDGSSELVSSLVAGLRGIAWWHIEGFADRLVTTADDGLVARLLRGERSGEVVPIRNAILSDPRKSSVLRARIIEDLIGRQVDETTIEIVKILSESDDESLSAISRSLLSEDGSFN
jgi:hypothetical protein